MSMILSIYSRGEWGGKPHFECNVCPACGFDEMKMIEHAATQHRASIEYLEMLGKPDMVLANRKNGFTGKVMLSSIFWQNDRTAKDTLCGMLMEALRLRSVGMQPVIGVAAGEVSEQFRIILDAFKTQCKEFKLELRYNLWTKNVGSSVLRNGLIYESRDCKYLMFTDGDIEIVPYSSMAMLDLLEFNNPAMTVRMGCVGAYSHNFSNDRAKCTESMALLPEMLLRFDHDIAWTQYGMFLREVFDKCLFEEDGPFTGPGWGFEDDDMGLQMVQAGWSIANFRGMCYLHRNLHSSITSMRGAGLDPEVLFQARKKYFVAKWRGVQHNIAGSQMPDGV